MVSGNLGHIIVVDDDEEVRDVLREYLTDEGYRVTTAADGAEMDALLKQTPVDLVILDLRLPGVDGLSLARSLRERSNVGIVILTGKDDVVDRVTGLEVGADDYIVKPFHFRELLARVRAVLRRSSEVAEAQREEVETISRVVRFAHWELNLDARTLRSHQGDEIELTSGEFDLLVAFLEHPHRTLSRDQLLDFARGRDAAPFDRSIDVLVGRVRRKIEADPRRPALIKTIRGAGYMFAADVKRI